jgi:hypothetical protein
VSEPTLPLAVESKLNEEERAEFETARDQWRRQMADTLGRVNLMFPHTTLLECPIAMDNRAEVRVSHWPSSVNEFDVLIKALTALRSAFLASKQPRKKAPAAKKGGGL